MDTHQETSRSSRPGSVDLEAQLKKALEENPRLKDWFDTAREARKVIDKADQTQSPNKPAPAVYSSAAV